jgi:hypothetical protein
MEWYRLQTQWNEGHSYDNADLTTSDLRAWYRDMLSHYPAMNGPDSSDDVDNPKVTDYSIGRSVIYAAFSWSEAEGALEVVFRLAEKHRVGFFDVSAEDGALARHYRAGETLRAIAEIPTIIWTGTMTGVYTSTLATAPARKLNEASQLRTDRGGIRSRYRGRRRRQGRPHLHIVCEEAKYCEFTRSKFCA